MIEIVLTQWINFSSDRNHYVSTSLIVAASVLLSLTTDCLGIVLELNVSVLMSNVIVNGRLMIIRLITNIIRDLSTHVFLFDSTERSTILS